MLCDECKKNEATIHFTNIVNNQKHEQHLCASCASKKQKNGKLSPFGSFDTNTIFDNDFFTNEFFTNMVYPAEFLHHGQTKKCSHCGMSFEDFNRTGKFGCSYCYQEFSEQIKPLVQRIQGSQSYEGRVPNRGHGIFRKQHEIKRLKSELMVAVQKEEFETAAKLRDEIKQLENSLEQ